MSDSKNPGQWIAEFPLEGAVPDVPRLLEQIEDARDAGARVALIDGCGEQPEATAATPVEWAAGLRDVVLSRLPVVFCFEGALSGPWADLALAADVRVCGADASLQGRLAGNARVRTLTDEGTALELFIGRKPLLASALLEAGLVSSVVAAGEALAEGRRVAATIASRGPIATQLAKEAIWRGLALPFDHALRFETDLTLLLQTTKDRAEGVRAFLEKRPPRFTGE